MTPYSSATVTQFKKYVTEPKRFDVVNLDPALTPYSVGRNAAISFTRRRFWMEIQNYRKT